MASDEEDYEVERILGERAGGAEFKVKWLGYPISEATWEPAAACAGCEDLVAQFRKQQQKSKASGQKRKDTTLPKARAGGGPAAKKVAKTKTSPAAGHTTEWFVEVCTYCSGVGCYYGSDPSEWPEPSTESHGPYASKAQAQSTAQNIRRATGQFEGWGGLFDEDEPPPWDSADMENMDEDENVSITIVSSAARAAAANKVAAKAARELDRAAASVGRPAPALKPGGKVGLDTSLQVREDIQMFARHPATAILGGRRTAASAFPKGFTHMIQRLSDMCYSVAAYCADPSRGARYALKKYPRTLCKSVVWLPPPGCGLGGPLAPAAAALIDCVHTDLINPGNGESKRPPY
jgi:hypothetical protein